MMKHTGPCLMSNIYSSFPSSQGSSPMEEKVLWKGDWLTQELVKALSDLAPADLTYFRALSPHSPCFSHSGLLENSKWPHRTVDHTAVPTWNTSPLMSWFSMGLAPMLPPGLSFSVISSEKLCRPLIQVGHLYPQGSFPSLIYFYFY